MLSRSKHSKRNLDGGDYLQQNSKEYVEELLHTWTMHSKTVDPNDLTLLGIAAEICLILSKRNSFDALEIFLQRLPDLSKYKRHHDILRARISLALHKRQYEIVQDIIKSNVFQQTDDIIKDWDEANYIQEEVRLQKPLTPLARFRVRKRHPPPTTICPSGIRKTASLPKQAIKVLRQWLLEHFNDPYPSGEEKIALAKLSGLTPNQVKTWFANARRRIHKGSDGMTTDQDLSINRQKSHHLEKSYEADVMRSQGSADEIGTTMLSSDMVGARSMARHAGEASVFERGLGASFRCVHAVHNAHACLHCQNHFAQSNLAIDDYILNSARLPSHATAIPTGLSMHQSAGYVYPRWPCFSPVQQRNDELDAWHRGFSYLPDGRAMESGMNGNPDRIEVLENGFTSLGLVDQYMQNSNFLPVKDPVATPVVSIKDELTDVGAARILADLSSKQNWALPCAYPAESMQCPIK